MAENKRDYSLPQLIRTDKILEALSQSDEPMALEQIIKYTGESKNNCFRIVETLVALRWVERVGGHFQLGMALAHFWTRKRFMLGIQQEDTVTKINELQGED